MFSNPKALAFIALATAAIVWGVNSSVMKITLLSVPLFSLALVRFGTAALILLPFVYKHLRIKREHFSLLFLSALFGVTFNISLFFYGVKLTTALNVGIITASLPLFTLFFAHTILNEKINKNIVRGALLGILGIGVIIGHDIFNTGVHFSPLGDLLALLATLSFVAFEIVSKELFKQYKALPITFYGFAIGALTFLPAAALELQMYPNWIVNLPSVAVFGILYGIFLSSLAAYSLWQWGLSKMQASRVGFFFYLDPIASTIAAVILLSEQITIPFIIGTILIFVGLFIAERRIHHYKLPNKS